MTTNPTPCPHCGGTGKLELEHNTLGCGDCGSTGSHTPTHDEGVVERTECRWCERPLSEHRRVGRYSVCPGTPGPDKRYVMGVEDERVLQSSGLDAAERALTEIDRHVSHAKMGDWSIALTEIRNIARTTLANLRGRHE